MKLYHGSNTPIDAVYNSAVCERLLDRTACLQIAKFAANDRAAPPHLMVRALEDGPHAALPFDLQSGPEIARVYNLRHTETSP